VAPVSALRALGEVAAAGLATGARVGAWMDAHRHDVFSALYEVGPAGAGVAVTLTEIEGPLVGAPAATLERWTTAGTLPAVVAGDGAVLHAGVLPAAVQVLAPPMLASTIARLAVSTMEAGSAVTPDRIQPLYVRRPDAEVARDAARSVR
jgi:tRNA A37 threonylcarbamoyladenosine modification protein TsaB